MSSLEIGTLSHVGDLKRKVGDLKRKRRSHGLTVIRCFFVATCQPLHLWPCSCA